MVLRQRLPRWRRYAHTNKHYAALLSLYLGWLAARMSLTEGATM
eukprot:COSAG06_NODE_502_length_14953_cov_15.585297_13_plen_44_part_00